MTTLTTRQKENNKAFFKNLFKEDKFSFETSHDANLKYIQQRKIASKKQKRLLNIGESMVISQVYDEKTMTAHAYFLKNDTGTTEIFDVNMDKNSSLTTGGPKINGAVYPLRKRVKAIHEDERGACQLLCGAMELVHKRNPKNFDKIIQEIGEKDLLKLASQIN